MIAISLIFVNINPLLFLSSFTSNKASISPSIIEPSGKKEITLSPSPSNEKPISNGNK